MALKVMADNGELISASQDGALYDVLANGKKFIISGIGNNMSVGNSTTSLTVTLATGECVIRGRHITNTAPISLTLSANTTGVLVLRLNSSNNTATFMSVADDARITNGNVNNASTTADLVLASYSTNASGVYVFTDRRAVLTGIYSNASTSTAGLMSATDKTKLDGIRAGRQVNSVTGVKGSSESSYRTGNVNITKANIGLGSVENKSSATIRSEITAANVTDALGYTPSGTNVYYQANGQGADYNLDVDVIDLVPLTATNAIISGTGLSISTYGIKVASAGVYRISGSVYMTVPVECTHYGTYIMKSSNSSAFIHATEVAGVLYAKPTNNGISTAAEAIPRLYNLAANDVVYLAARVRGAGGATVYTTNKMTYLTVEKVG